MAPRTFKQKFNAKHKQPLNKANSIKEIAKKSGIKYKNALKIVQKGKGAFYSAGARKGQTVHSWSMGRLYASVSKGSKSSKIDKDLLN